MAIGLKNVYLATVLCASILRTASYLQEPQQPLIPASVLLSHGPRWSCKSMSAAGCAKALRAHTITWQTNCNYAKSRQAETPDRLAVLAESTSSICTCRESVAEFRTGHLCLYSIFGYIVNYSTKDNPRTAKLGDGVVAHSRLRTTAVESARFRIQAGSRFHDQSQPHNIHDPAELRNRGNSQLLPTRAWPTASGAQPGQAGRRPVSPSSA